jgi:hypothetical protein
MDYIGLLNLYILNIAAHYIHTCISNKFKISTDIDKKLIAQQSINYLTNWRVVNNIKV